MTERWREGARKAERDKDRQSNSERKGEEQGRLGQRERRREERGTEGRRERCSSDVRTGGFYQLEVRTLRSAVELSRVRGRGWPWGGPGMLCCPRQINDPLWSVTDPQQRGLELQLKPGPPGKMMRDHGPQKGAPSVLQPPEQPRVNVSPELPPAAPKNH